MPKTIQLQVAVMRLVMKSDQMISGLCRIPCSMKKIAPTPIMRKVGRAMSSVFLVRMVVVAWGR